MDFLTSYWHIIISAVGIIGAAYAWLSERKTRKATEAGTLNSVTSGMMSLYKTFVSDFNDNYNNLRKSLDDQIKKEEGYESKLGTCEAKISQLTEKILKYEDMITGYAAKVSQLTEKILKYEDMITGYKAQVSSLKNELKTYNNGTRNN